MTRITEKNNFLQLIGGKDIPTIKTLEFFMNVGGIECCLEYNYKNIEYLSNMFVLTRIEIRAIINTLDEDWIENLPTLEEYNKAKVIFHKFIVDNNLQSFSPYGSKHLITSLSALFDMPNYYIQEPFNIQFGKEFMTFFTRKNSVERDNLKNKILNNDAFTPGCIEVKSDSNRYTDTNLLKAIQKGLWLDIACNLVFEEHKMKIDLNQITIIDE